MATYQTLPAELRLAILEYPLWSFAWLDPPDADALDLDKWYYPPQPDARQTMPIIWFAHRTSPETLLRPLLHVSKQFQYEIKHVWKQLVEPKLRHVISFTCIGHGTHTYRPLVGTFAKWLCKPTSPAANGVIEARIRFFDHEMGAEGEHRGLDRCVPNRIPCPLGFNYLNESLMQAYWRVRVGELPEHDALSQAVIASMTTFKIVFDSTLPDGLHWTHSKTIRYKDSDTNVPISLHPYHNAMDSLLSTPRNNLLHHNNRLPLSRCDIFVDDVLVRMFQRVGTVITEEAYRYDLPVDLLCLP